MANFEVKVEGVVVDTILNILARPSATNRAGFFEVVLENIDGRRTSQFKVGNRVEISFTLADTPQLVMAGRVEYIKPDISGASETLTLSGSDFTILLSDVKNVVEDYENAEVSAIVVNLILKHLPGVTSNNVQVTTKTLPKFAPQGISLIEVMRQLASFVGFNFFIDADLDFHFEAVGTPGKTLTMGEEILNYSFPSEATVLANRLFVYGDGLVVRVDDATSQASFGVVEKKLVDQNLKDVQSATERGNAELADLKDPYFAGEVTTLIDPDLKPGQLVTLNIPEANIAAQSFFVFQVEHRLDEFVSTLKVARFSFRTEEQIADMLKRIEAIEAERVRSGLPVTRITRIQETLTFDDTRVKITRLPINDTFRLGNNPRGRLGKVSGTQPKLGNRRGPPAVLVDFTP